MSSIVEHNMDIPLIQYTNEDKSAYPKLNTIYNPKIDKNYIDADNDFLLGNSGGVLMNINFTFIDTYKYSVVANTYERNLKSVKVNNWINDYLNSLPRVTKYDKLNYNRLLRTKNKFYYCPAEEGSITYQKFWAREKLRRNSGMTAKCKLINGVIEDLHITGDHYAYLNYGRLQRTYTEKERVEYMRINKKSPNLKEGFPRFWDGDYWNFKLDLLITLNEYHLTKSKARGKGYSFKRGNQGANTINSTPNALIMLCAIDIKYLTGKGKTTQMLKNALDWYELNTHWGRGYLSQNLRNIELGYKKQSTGDIKHGYQSGALSVTLRNNASAAIGARADEIDVEEAGICGNLREFLEVTLSSTEVGSSNVGTIRAYGTGGAEDADWEGFAYAFYNPKAFKMLPLENIWDVNARDNTCGFFHSQLWNLEGYMDKHGNSLLEEALIYTYKELDEARKNKSDSDFRVFKAQRAMSPEDAFDNTSDNLFASAELSYHHKLVKYTESFTTYVDGLVYSVKGNVQFKSNVYAETENIKTHPFIDKIPFDVKGDLHGCVRMYYPPFTDESGNIPDNLYAIVYDPVGKDIDSKELTITHSLNSVQVVMLPNSISNSTGDIIVAEWAGRPNTMKEADAIVLNLCKLYNAKCLVEVDRGETVANFRIWNSLHWLFKNPMGVINGKDTGTTSYGVSVGKANLADTCMIYLADWLYSMAGVNENGEPVRIFNYVNSLMLLTELVGYKGGNADRISSMRLYPLIRKMVAIKKKTARIQKNNDFVTLTAKFDQYGLFN